MLEKMSVDDKRIHYHTEVKTRDELDSQDTLTRQSDIGQSYSSKLHYPLVESEIEDFIAPLWFEAGYTPCYYPQAIFLVAWFPSPVSGTSGGQEICDKRKYDLAPNFFPDSFLDQITTEKLHLL